MDNPKVFRSSTENSRPEACYFPITQIVDAPRFLEFPWKFQGRSPCNFPITRIMDAPNFQEFHWKLQGQSPCNFPIIWSLWMPPPKNFWPTHGFPIPKFSGLLRDRTWFKYLKILAYGWPFMDAPYGYPHVLDALSFQEFYFPKTAIMDAPSFHEIPWK